MLTAVHLQLEKALVYYEVSPQESRQSIQDARDVTKMALQDVRRSVSTLRAEEPAFYCLLREVTLLIEQLQKNDLVVDFSCKGGEEGFSRQGLMTLYRVFQEGCTNIQRHAQARHVQVHLDFGPGEACLSLSDDGIGFDAASQLAQDPGKTKSYGLPGMQEHLIQISGSLYLESAPGQGTRLLARVPKRNMQC